jgi:hypothetical protein
MNQNRQELVTSINRFAEFGDAGQAPHQSMPL